MMMKKGSAPLLLILGMVLITAGCQSTSPAQNRQAGSSAVSSTAKDSSTGGSSPDSQAGQGSPAAVNSSPAGKSTTDQTDTSKSTVSNTGSEAAAASSGSTTAESSTGSSVGSAAADKQVKLVPFHGEVQHIFFHPLIAYPSRAFDGDSLSQGYNDWFVTVGEFDRMLPALYQKNYILIDINSMYSVKTVNGKQKVVKNQLMLPPGKKPLVISVDDINYYNYMRQNGNVFKLVLDKDGNVATYSMNPQGQKVISRDNGIVPILDQFVAKHPDFSFHGAKAMLNLTGYEGILGYRTNQLDSPDYSKMKAEAMKVVKRLKDTGWTFASHGYGHLHDAKISYTHFVKDTNQWLKEVEPLIGPTSVYVYPFGEDVKTGGAKYQYLLKKDFHMICGVGPNPYIRWEQDAVLMDRAHIDGLGLHSQRKLLLKFFDSNKIIDPDRPKQY